MTYHAHIDENMYQYDRNYYVSLMMMSVDIVDIVVESVMYEDNVYLRDNAKD